MTSIDAYDGYTNEADEGNEDAFALGPVAEPAPRTTAEQRFVAALVCLGGAYALSWAELILALVMGFPGDAAGHSLAASIASRVLIGLLYLCVASRLQWARWATVGVGFCSVMLVAPTLALQWHGFPAGAAMCGAGLVCQLAATLYLLSPMPRRATN